MLLKSFKSKLSVVFLFLVIAFSSSEVAGMEPCDQGEEFKEPLYRTILSPVLGAAMNFGFLDYQRSTIPVSAYAMACGVVDMICWLGSYNRPGSSKLLIRSGFYFLIGTSMYMENQVYKMGFHLPVSAAFLMTTPIAS